MFVQKYLFEIQFSPSLLKIISKDVDSFHFDEKKDDKPNGLI